MFRSVAIILNLPMVFPAMAANVPVDVGEAYCPQSKEVNHDILGCFAAALIDDECLNKEQVSFGKGGRQGRCLCDTEPNCNATEGLSLGSNGYARYYINAFDLPIEDGLGYCSSYKEVRHDLMGCFAATLLDPDCINKERVSFGKGNDTGLCLCDTIENCTETSNLDGLDLSRFYIPQVPAPPSDWEILNDNSSISTAVFADGEEHEVSMEFQVRNGYGQQVRVSLLEDDCQTLPWPADVVNISHHLNYTGDDWNLLRVDLDVKEDVITNSTLWIEDTPATGRIAACLLLELLSQDMNFASVYYYKHPLNMTVDMRKTFGIDGIEPLRDVAAPGEELEFDVNYNVTACQCDGFLPPLCTQESSLEANVPFHLCVSPSSEEVAIQSVDRLILKQDGYDIAYPITSGSGPNALTTVAKAGGHAVITTKLTTPVYMALIPSDGNPSDILALGEVALEFVPSSGRRMVETGTSQATNEAGKANFEVDLYIAPSGGANADPDEPVSINGHSSSALLLSAVGSVGATVLLAFGLLVWQRRGKSADK